MNPNTPPRFLTGITLLFWGFLTGNLVWALVAAILVEAKSWTTLRWDFSPSSYIRAWHFSVLCSAIIALLAWLNGMKLGQLHTLSIWAPLTILPLELALRYGKSQKIPLNTFSFFARKKLQHYNKQGYHISPRMIHTGYLYLIITLLATAIASKNGLHHFIGLAVISTLCLFFNAKRHGIRPVAWTMALLIVVAFSYRGHWSIINAYKRYSKGKHGEVESRYRSANEARTSIGRLGEIKLSPHIFWRMQVKRGKTPHLLRTATYQKYSRALWKYDPGPYDPDGYRDEDGYVSESRLRGVNTESNIRYFSLGNDTDTPNVSGEPHVKIVGEVDSSVGGSPIPLPHFIQGIGDLGRDNSKVSLECNTVGTVKINNPDYHIVSYSAWTGDRSMTEVDAPSTNDLSVPAPERPAIQRICKQLDLEKGMEAQEVLRKLRRFFNSEFTYTTHLTTPKIEQKDRWTAIGLFLEKTRAGHCEYFATATTLILRECGIPSRYCVGFSAIEYSDERSEWILRGKHSHSWSRVWNNDHWEDADLTPPSWAAIEMLDNSHWKIRLADWWQLVREDFLMWRTKEENILGTGIVIGSLLAVLCVWLFWRLWKSRQRDTHQNRLFKYQRPADASLSALNKMESTIARKIGARPLGLPLCRWVKSLEEIDPNLSNIINPLTKKHSALRFDPNHLRPESLTEIDALCLELKRRLKLMNSVTRRNKSR